MSAIIGGDAAKLAGLQIDTLQKVRSGQITLEQLEKFNNLSPDAREERFGNIRNQANRTTFTMFIDLGIVTVPDDYNHKTQLSSFKAKYQNEKVESFSPYNSLITDESFSAPSCILRSGDMLHVQVFRQVGVDETTSSEERMEFLSSRHAVYTGAQGASLVWEQKRARLPRGLWYLSMDREDCLPRDDEGFRRVPGISVDHGGNFGFNLGYWVDTWVINSTFLLFYLLSPLVGQPIG